MENSNINIPIVGGECWVREYDDKLHIHKVIKVHKDTFDTQSIENEAINCLGIKIKRFRKK